MNVPKSPQLGPKDRGSTGTRGTERNPKTGWRRGWDSNPRDPFRPNGFQDRRLQPLGHPSAGLSTELSRLLLAQSRRLQIDFSIGNPEEAGLSTPPRSTSAIGASFSGGRESYFATNLGPGPNDSKFLHAEVEGRAIQAQPGCRSARPGQHPAGLLQD